MKTLINFAAAPRLSVLDFLIAGLLGYELGAGKYGMAVLVWFALSAIIVLSDDFVDENGKPRL